jgi:hypothetical protein
MNPAPPVTMIRRGRSSTSEFWCCINDTRAIYWPG